MPTHRTLVRLTAPLRKPPSLQDVEQALLTELAPYADGRHQVPNAWTVQLSPRDGHRRKGDLLAWSTALAGRLVAQHDRFGLAASGLVQVVFEVCDDVDPGRFRVVGAVVSRGAAAVRRPGLLPGRPRVVLPAGGSARWGTPTAAGIDREVMVPPGAFVVGRARNADLRLHDTTVSPRHVELRGSAEQVELRDLGSRNGTTVDGVPVTTAVLQDGNRIELGETTLVFHRDEPADDGGREGGELE